MIVVVGETASGKSALGLQLARQFGGEIICADSMTVYPGFDIGTAKPNAAERAEVRHHLLDIADPAGGFSAAQFQQLAQVAIDYISARGKLPIMVGGSGLYVDSVLYGYDFRPSTNTYERDVLNTMPLSKLLLLAHERGLAVSDDAATNPRRLIRLLETNGAHAARQPIRENTCVIGLAPDREDLEQRIRHRVEKMVIAGLEGEARELAGLYGWETEAMRSIGYREWHDYFSGQAGIHETREEIVRSTMRLAKKQRTWFKRNNSIHWVATEDEAADLVAKWLRENIRKNQATSTKAER
jgi:tRNA dimethylallyltransferase